MAWVRAVDRIMVLCSLARPWFKHIGVLVRGGGVEILLLGSTPCAIGLESCLLNLSVRAKLFSDADKLLISFTD